MVKQKPQEKLKCRILLLTGHGGNTWYVWRVWGPKWETLKNGLALRWETKMMPGERDRGVVYVTVLIGSLDFRARGQRMITIDSCYNEDT